MLCLSYVYSSTNLENRAEQVLPRNEGDEREREREEGSGGKWPKQCMHI
jgi:hypothetical protein